MFIQRQEETSEDSARSIVGRRRSALIRGSAELPTTTPSIPIEQIEPGRSDGASTSVIPATSSISQEERKKGKMWSTEEIMVYYEAVKQLGKDFDGIVKAMQKKKVHKDKDQIRNFFFNCVKFLRSLCDINIDAMFPNICRDAKELFFVINSCEWRKRTGAAKYQADRMKELVLEGTTTIKANKKNMIIKTPTCPALQKYFSENRLTQNDKHSEVIITLKPFSFREKSLILSCEQNPLLCLKISTNDRISRIFELLNEKWKKISLLTNKKFKLKLLPDKSLEIGRTTLIGVDPCTDIVSLNKLKRENDYIQVKKENPSKISICEAPPPQEEKRLKYSLSINEELLLGGLTTDNIGEASIAELYCLCGLSHNIELAYGIDYMENKTETWKIFRDLIVREYGDQFTLSGREEDKLHSTIALSSSETVEPTAKKIRKAVPHITSENPISIQRIPQSSREELEDIKRFSQQLKSSINKNNKNFAKRKRDSKNECDLFGKMERRESTLSQLAPTDFSQLIEGKTTTPQTSQHLISQRSEPNQLEFTPKKMVSNNSLCSESMQKMAHNVMLNEVLYQDSNQAINVFSDLLDDFEESSEN